MGICAIPKKIKVLSVSEIDVQPVNLVDTEVAMSPIAEGNSSTSPADLLHGNDVVQVAHPGASKVRAGCDPQEAHVAQLLPEVLAVREVIGFVDCFCMRC